MKRKSILTLLAITALVLTYSSCKDAPTSDAKCRTIELATGSAAGDSAHVKFVLPDYADRHLNEVILEQLNEALGGTYEGSYADPDSMARHYLATYMQEMSEERADFETEMTFERSLKVYRTYETDRLVTFNVQQYQFSGGAHGGTLCFGLTFRKPDGRRMSMNTLGNLVGDEEWSNLQKEGLKEYFEVDTDEELQDCLLDVETYMIPAPEYEPYFSEKGMEFVYQQYEIAPYAAGLPSYTIPYDRLRKYLNVTGRRLLGE